VVVIWCDGVMGCGGFRFRVGPGLPITHANTQAHTHTQKGQDNFWRKKIKDVIEYNKLNSNFFGYLKIYGNFKWWWWCQISVCALFLFVCVTYQRIS
jgi:hypothetical protein